MNSTFKDVVNYWLCLEQDQIKQAFSVSIFQWGLGSVPRQPWLHLQVGARETNVSKENGSISQIELDCINQCSSYPDNMSGEGEGKAGNLPQWSQYCTFTSGLTSNIIPNKQHQDTTRLEVRFWLHIQVWQICKVSSLCCGFPPSIPQG